jgi:molybdenum cofactor biosynthesis enzyme MoaA
MTTSLGFMDKEVFEKIVDECAEHLPVALVPFFRGESLLHNHFNDFIRYAKAKGLGPIQFTTNATLLNEKMNERILSSGIDFISFSLDTIDKESYEKNRLGADFDNEEILRREIELIKTLAPTKYFINRLKNILPEQLIPYGRLLFHTGKKF